MFSIANTSTVLYRVRDDGTQIGDIAAMADETWRDRLKRAVEKSGRPLREISRTMGRSDGYVYGIIHDAKEPGIDSVVELCRVLGISVTELLFGVEMSDSTEKLLRIYAGLSEDQKADFLRLAESAASLAART